MPDLFTPPVSGDHGVDTDTPKTVNSDKQAFTPVLHHIGFFATYGENPDNLHFGTQEPGERILLFLRRDFITNVPWIISGILLIFAPFLLSALASLSNIQFSAIPSNYSLIILAFYYIIVATYIYVNFITWYFNISLVTNKRILDIDFEDIIYKNVAETKLSLVQDVSYKQIGAIQTFFDFGNVLIQTAAAVDTFELTSVPQPQHVVTVVQSLIGKEEEPNVA